MANHSVTLNYGKDGVAPNPDPIFVRRGDRVCFTVGAGAPAGAKARITLRDAASFSAPNFEEGDPDIEVVADLEKETAYDCDLVLDGKIVPRSGSASGGGMKPGSTEP